MIRTALPISDHPERVLALAAPWRELRIYATLDSTQRHAGRLAAAGEDLRGVALRTERQTAGHGRQGRHWVSADGGLYVTAGLPQTWTLPDAFLGWTPLVAALACARLVRERWDVETRIKWPNDVLMEGRKLAGLLGEASSVGAPGEGAKRVLLMGMGLNWTNDARAAGVKDGFAATALVEQVPCLESGEREGFLAAWLARMAADVDRLMADPAGTTAQLRLEIEELLWRRGEIVQFEKTEQGDVRGRLLGLGTGGAALVQLEDGTALEAHCGRQAADEVRAGKAGSGRD